jgi:hypothetical protein
MSAYKKKESMDLQIKQWRSVMIVDDIIFSDENMFDLQQQRAK